MVKNMIIAMLIAKVLMNYMIIPPTPAEGVICFFTWLAISFISTLMTEDAIDRVRKNLRKEHNR